MNMLVCPFYMGQVTIIGMFPFDDSIQSNLFFTDHGQVKQKRVELAYISRISLIQSMIFKQMKDEVNHEVNDIDKM